MTASKKPEQKTGSGKGSRQEEKARSRSQSAVVQERRKLSKKQREQQRQRRALAITSAAIGLVLLVLIGGLLYDQVWYPSRTVAQVNDTTLTRREAQQRIRSSIVQLLASGQLAGQTPALNQQLGTLGAQPVNDSTLQAWQEDELLQQGAAELGVEVSAEEIAQALAGDLGPQYLPQQTPVITSTDTLTDTGTLTDTDTLTADEDADDEDTAADDEDTAADEAATPDTLPTFPPTATPAPTPVAEVALEQKQQIIDIIYDNYVTEIEQANELGQTDTEPLLTRAEIERALEQQYRQGLLNEKVQEQLVPEDEFSATEEPERVQARQIFLEVDVPADASEEEMDEAFAERLEEAEELVEQLRDEADFAELAAEESDDPASADEGGDLGYFNAEGFSEQGATYHPNVVEAAFALEGDEIGDPVRTPFGWHILQVTDREVPDAEQQLQRARQEAFDEWLDEFREQSDLSRITETTTTPAPGQEAVPPEDLPTPVPTYLPGPPTAIPTPEVVPTPADAPAEEPVPATPETGDE